MSIFKLIPQFFTVLVVFTAHFSWSQDADLDGVPDYLDLDDDNDGILDKDEMRCTYDLTGSWESLGGHVYESKIDSQTISVSFQTPSSSYISGFHTGNITNTNPAWFSDALVPGHSSFVVNCRWDLNPENGSSDIDDFGDDKQILYMTIDFGQYVENPVLHFDRLGGSGGGTTNSGQLTVITPGITLLKLSGTDDFEVTATTINRTPDVSGTTNVEATQTASQGTAAGSVQFTGFFKTITFAYTGVGVEGLGFDTIEFVYGADVCFDLDSDNDGSPNREDEDSDNDGCPDVSEAGYTDQNFDGILGNLPLVVDPTNGLVIGSEALDGYTGTLPAVIDGIVAPTPVCSVALPVEMCFFDLDVIGCTVDLEWVTCSEKNNDYFKLERSEDGVKWNEIGRVDGMTNSTTNTEYSFSDLERKLNGTYYYRIVQFDLDGTETISNSIGALVSCGAAEEVLVLLLKAGNTDYTVTTTSHEEIKEVVITNLIGATVYSASLPETKQTVSFSSQDLSQGIYFVNCITESGESYSNRVFVK